MTTVSELDLFGAESESDHEEEQLDEENLGVIIMDLSKSNDLRLKALEMYYYKVGDQAIEYVSILSGMYQMSGTSVIEQFLYKCCTHGDLSPFLKLQCAKALIAYQELEEGSGSGSDEEDIEFKKEENERIRARNTKRREVGYDALDYACYDLESMSTPCRVESIFLLMQSEKYKKNANIYFGEFVEDQKIDYDFRYKTILSIEKKDEIEDKIYFICNACLKFLFDKENQLYYRILAGQYLINHSTHIPTKLAKVESVIYEFASNEDNEYDRRADAADILLKTTDTEMKKKAQQIIMDLASVNGKVRNVFDNAQNVHTEEVEESVAIALEALSKLPLLRVDGKAIDYEYVNKQVTKLIDEDKNEIKLNMFCGNKDCEHVKCNYCDGCCENDEDEYCSETCIDSEHREDKIKVAMNRIFMDRSLYSKFNNTLVMILLKVCTYLSNHDHRETMEQRLLEELVEMSGTCSSGFATRLINTISGFGEFNIRISWEDQIVSNFIGRLNALTRKIADYDSPYYDKKLNDVVELWLNNEENVHIKKAIDKKLRKSDRVEHNIPMKEIIANFLSTDRENKVNTCVEDFAVNVVNEMAVENSNWKERMNFLLFFRTNMPNIREELYDEFKTYVNHGDFELYMRKAIMIYEGEI